MTAIPAFARASLGLPAFWPFATSRAATTAAPERPQTLPPAAATHLDRLEAEAIHIIREACAQAENPAILYSIGKDSSVLLHLAQKAFAPTRLPMPLLHVDTGWKFRAMIAFRDRIAAEQKLDLIVHRNPQGVADGVGPFTHGADRHTAIMKTAALKQALDAQGFDVCLGGARRDEEKSRAKERVFSMRAPGHQWDPRRQRPEPWRLYHGRKRKGETIRVFPLSDWTELDVWLYIHREAIPVAPLYFAAERPVVSRDGMLIAADEGPIPLEPHERIETRRVRYRTLGCWPLTGAVESAAATIPAIIAELVASRTSERAGRAIDRDQANSMERKKQDGYF